MPGQLPSQAEYRGSDGDKALKAMEKMPGGICRTLPRPRALPKRAARNSHMYQWVRAVRGELDIQG